MPGDPLGPSQAAIAGAISPPSPISARKRARSRVVDPGTPLAEAGAVPQPRLIRPNATYAISRRTQDRRFMLRPDPILNALFVWVLAVTAAQCRIEVHVATVMSTHFHPVVTAPYENVSRFMQLFDCRLARALKVLRRLHRGVVWAPGELSIVELETTAAVVEQIAYPIVNPVKAGLVFASADWPGVTASVAQLGNLVLTALRPAFYFVAGTWPAIASIRFTLPTALIELGRGVGAGVARGGGRAPGSRGAGACEGDGMERAGQGGRTERLAVHARQELGRARQARAARRGRARPGGRTQGSDRAAAYARAFEGSRGPPSA